MEHDISVIEERARVNEPVAESDRICWYDNVKFILITLVTVGHFIDKNTADSQVYQGLFLFIYTFHMPSDPLGKGEADLCVPFRSQRPLVHVRLGGL